MKILSWALVNAITRFYQGLSSEATTCSLSQDSRCPVLLSYQHLETLNLRQRHLQPMSLCQSGSHPFYSMLCRLFKCAPNTETHSWRHRWCCSSLPLVFPELKRWRLLKLQMFFFFPSFWFFKMKFMRRREGLIMESRDVIIKHWRSLLRIAEPFLLLQDTAEAGVTASIVLVCPAGE